MYDKYHFIFSEDCDEMEKEGVEILKAFYYENVLPELFGFSAENECSDKYSDNELDTELECYVAECLELVLSA